MAGPERELEAVQDEQGDGMDDELNAQVPGSTVQVEQDYMSNLERSVQGQQFTIEAMKQRIFALEIDIVNLTAESLSHRAGHQ